MVPAAGDHIAFWVDDTYARKSAVAEYTAALSGIAGQHSALSEAGTLSQWYQGFACKAFGIPISQLLILKVSCLGQMQLEGLKCGTGT